MNKTFISQREHQSKRNAFTIYKYTRLGYSAQLNKFLQNRTGYQTHAVCKYTVSEWKKQISYHIDIYSRYILL